MTLTPSFFLLILIFVLILILKSSWFKGVFGEFFVNLHIKFSLDKNHYHLLKNVTLPTDDGTTQIDHIIVSTYGVFVLETKNMKGWIFGGAKQKTWTQKIYKHTNKFQNPIHQNYKHIKTLESLLELKEHQIHSLIVFIGDSTFKTNMPDYVTDGSGFIKYIKSKEQPVLTESDVKAIINKIESGQLSKSLKTHRSHIKHVKNIVADKQNNIQ